MRISESEVMSFIQDNDVKFIKLAFCDVKGCLKIITILPPMLEKAFSTGIPVKPKLIDGFGSGIEDVYLRPDFETMCLLPWRPTHGSVLRFFCNIFNKDGTPFSCDTRAVLSDVYAKALKNDISIEISNGLEFYLFKNDHEGNPTDLPFDYAGYMDEAPADKGEDVRRDICLTLEEMNITPVISHHNAGPGQNEVDFVSGRPVAAADNVIAYRSVVKNMAERNGLNASFRPKPLSDECGNSFRITFKPRYKGALCPEQFLSGMIAKVKEITAVLNSQNESYERLGDSDIPSTITWNNKSGHNIFSMDKDNGTVTIISPDSAANPYLAYALLIAAGCDGILDYKSLKDCKEDTLPTSLSIAKDLCRNSEFVHSVLSQDLVTAVADK